MLKQWQKLENSINDLLSKIFASIKRFLLKLIPKSVFKFKDKVINFILDSYYWLKAAVINFTIDSKDRIIYRKDQLFNLLSSLQSYPIKEKLQEKGGEVSSFLKKNPKQHLSLATKSIIIIKHYLKAFFARFNATQISITAITILLFVFGANLMIKSSRFIWLQENQTRKPASVEEEFERPDYHMLDKKTFVVLNIKVPVFVKNLNQVTAVTIDFGVRTSNRFATLFLTEYEYKLKDHFFMTMYPIESNFPIQEEGKNIIKEKIQFELNEFLKQENVEGEVEEVTIMYIIAT